NARMSRKKGTEMQVRVQVILCDDSPTEITGMRADVHTRCRNSSALIRESAVPFLPLTMTRKLANFGLPLLAKELIEQAARKRTYVIRAWPSISWDMPCRSPCSGTCA